jgi:8-oxo-dGTP pyrophosphatase MutT (NUDIX family)
MNWEIEKSEYIVSDKWLKVRSDKCRMPNGRIVEPYYIIEYPDWINVVGITKEKDVVFVKLYRHGIAKTVLELPSGTIEACDKAPVEAAKRELLEETGYTSDNFLQTGIVSPNPSNHTNLNYCFIAKDLELVSKPQLDCTEEIETILIPVEKAIDMFTNGEFLQAMHVSSFYYAMKYLTELT